MKLSSVDTDSLKLEYVGMTESVHELYLLPHVESIGLLFVHLQHHNMTCPDMTNLEHLAEESSPQLLGFKVIKSVEVGEGSLESLTGRCPTSEGRSAWPQ